MTFTAKLANVAKNGDPGVIDLQITYLDTAHPDWSLTKHLPITLNPDLGPIQQRQAIRAQIVTDAQRYRVQNAAYAALKTLEDDDPIEITPP